MWYESLTTWHPSPPLDGDLAPSFSSIPLISPSARTISGVRPMAKPTAPTWFTLVRSLRWLDPRHLPHCFLSLILARVPSIRPPTFVVPMSSHCFHGVPQHPWPPQGRRFLHVRLRAPPFRYPPLYSDHSRSFPADPGIKVSMFIQFVGTFKVPTKFSRHLAYEFSRPGLIHIKFLLPSRRLRVSAPPLPVFSSLKS